MEKKTYCPFCGNPSIIDDNAELRDTNRALLEQLDEARRQQQASEARAAELEKNLDLANAHALRLMQERDELARQLAEAQKQNGAYVPKFESDPNWEQFSAEDAPPF